MSGAVHAEFDGSVFVPLGPVTLPPGTRCFMHVITYTPPPPITDEHRAAWEQIQRELDATEPYFPTVDEAIRASRGRP